MRRSARNKTTMKPKLKNSEKGLKLWVVEYTYGAVNYCTVVEAGSRVAARVKFTRANPTAIAVRLF